MKKRFLFLACAWLLCLGNMMADEITDKIIINPVTVPQGGSVDLVVGYEISSSPDHVGFTFMLDLPEGLTLATDADGDAIYVKDETSISKLDIKLSREKNTNIFGFAGQPSTETSTIKGTSGTLLTLTLQADASLEVGSTHTVNVTKVTFQQRANGSVTDINLPDFTFTVTIGEPQDNRTILDETFTTAPASATGVDVRVKRTIKANEWSTICLPFAMTEAQVKAAFGDDVKIGDFNDYVFDEESETISVKFVTATAIAIAANHPYIIKVSNKVTEFTVDGVDIDPEESPMVNFGTKRKPRAMVGTYVANTKVGNGCLFLSGNQFWYSVGSTKMKAFRAYFDFDNLLPDFEDNYAEARISFSFEEPTGIIEQPLQVNDEDTYYDLQGRRVTTPANGIYIRDGKKVTVK